MDELAALRLQVEWGADEALEEAPLDRMRRPTPEPPARPARPGPAVLPATVIPAEAGSAAAQAEQAALSAGSIPELEAALGGFKGCALRDTATRLVFADGDPAAALMLIGESPGADEDRSGRPFAGASGGYLDRMLASIGLERTRLRIGMLVPWRPPGGRAPSESEVALCLPFLQRHIALVGPARLVLLGPLIARALIPARMGRRSASRGWVEVGVRGLAAPVPALALPNPAALVAKPAGRREAWAELRLLRRTLDCDLSRS